MRGRSVIAALLAAAALLTGTAQAVSRDEAREIAARYVPEDCVVKDVDREGLSFEVEFSRASADERYEVTLKSVSGIVVSVESEYTGRMREGDAVYGVQDAARKASELFPGAEALLAFEGKDDKVAVLQVLFATDECWGLMTMGPQSGTVYETKRLFQDVERIRTTEFLPFDEITEKVLSVSGGEIDEILLEYDDGQLLYAGEIDTGLFQGAEFEVNPTTGKIVEWDD